MKRALITGISGQDGSYLAEYLLGMGYEVHGLLRRHSVVENQTTRIDHIRHDLKLHYGDMTDAISLLNIMTQFKFDEVYNLAGMSNVGISFAMPQYTQEVNYKGFISLIDAIMRTQDTDKIKIYQASSSEMFGNNIDEDRYQRETTPMSPVSPYGVSKLSAHNYAQHIRRSTGLWISCGILFNHESPRRGANFVTGKICKGVADIVKGRAKTIQLGNIDAFRDWGHAKDYVRVMWQMLNEAPEPDDFVCATGESISVEEFLQDACDIYGLDYREVVEHNGRYNRREELDYLRGDNSKLKGKIDLYFHYDREDMIREMIAYYLD